MDLFSRKATFEMVKENPEAVMFHAVKFQSGSRYPLALQCFQFIKQEQSK